MGGESGGVPQCVSSSRIGKGDAEAEEEADGARGRPTDEKTAGDEGSEKREEEEDRNRRRRIGIGGGG
eukprot:750542-Hanusia_phi.AAC.1